MSVWGLKNVSVRVLEVLLERLWTSMEIAVVSKTRDMLEGFVKERSFKWLTKKRSVFDDDFDEMGGSPPVDKNWLPELSVPANIVVCRCAKILAVTVSCLLEKFDADASDALKQQLSFARNFLEYCCFTTIAQLIQEPGYLDDVKFRRLTFDMMIAWEFPAASSGTFPVMSDDVSVGVKAFSRIAPLIPIVTNVVVVDKIFEILATSETNRLHFSVYDKYLVRLERVVRKFHCQSDSSLLSNFRAGRVERILEVDGTVTSQPVLEHVGISAWPGRLTLTDHALYFETLRVLSYDNAKKYDLTDDLQQVVKPDLTGPWGTRIFDKAVFYKSTALSEPVIMEFPELKGHNRRDYWLSIIREVLYAHRFLSKYRVAGLEREEVLLKAIFGILRVQVLKEMTSSSVLISYDNLLMFNVCDKLPRGDLILEILVDMLTLRDVDQGETEKIGNSMYSVSAHSLASQLGSVFGSSASSSSETGLVFGDIAVGQMTLLEKAVKEARSTYESAALVKDTVSGVKVEGLDSNLAVMKELLSPMTELWNWLGFVFYWEEPLKSLAFCLICTYVILRGWMVYASAAVIAFFAFFMLLTRFFTKGRPVDELKVKAPSPMNAMEQLLAVQNAISQAEEIVQEGNITLLKCRSLLISAFPQATEILAAALLCVSLVLVFVPMRHVMVLIFLEAFTRYSPIRRASSERWTRRMRDWWFSIPAAPVVLEKVTEDKKKN